ncbi:hypothetical protein ACQUWX_27075, partial [Ralstonia pseudosolanacearum]
MRRIRLSLFGLGLLAAMPSFAGPAGTLGPAAIAAPDKVYPPLPTLAMLPVEVRILPTYKVVSDLGMLNSYF